MKLQRLAQVIYQAGFDAFAIMPVTTLDFMLPILKKAQKEDRYPDFADPDITKRINPKNLQKSARSVITLAKSYKTDISKPTPALHGTVSRFALSLDYHTVLDQGMDIIIRYLEENYQVTESTKAVDTSFLIDRALAIEAGLGYPGKNCTVYVPPFGSWVFLAEILLDQELPPTHKRKKIRWICPEGCDLCIKACPTGALLEPGKIQPKRCVSYLTQMSGSIPLSLRDKITNQLWGCDICQQVCPLNRDAKFSPHSELNPILEPHIELLPLLDLNKKKFSDTFGKTSLAWRGKNILQRNACIILGNQREHKALPKLKETAQKHPSTVVQEAASWAVKKIKFS